MIADAPPHGLKFHEKIFNDDHEAGCPCGLTLTDLCLKIRLKDISFNIIEIQNCFGVNMLTKFNYQIGYQI